MLSFWNWLTGKREEESLPRTAHTADELARVTRAFQQQLKLNGPAQPGSKLLSVEAFAGLCGQLVHSGNKLLLSALHSLVSRGKQGTSLGDVLTAQEDCRTRGVDFACEVLAEAQRLLAAKAGTVSHEQAHGSPGCNVSFSTLKTVIAQALEAVLTVPSTGPASSKTDTEQVAAAAAQGAMLNSCNSHSRSPTSTSPSDSTVASHNSRISASEFSSWAKNCPALHSIIAGLVLRIGQEEVEADGGGSHSKPDAAEGCAKQSVDNEASIQQETKGPVPLPPRLLGVDRLQPEQLLLDHPAWALLLSQCMAQGLRHEWRLLFSSEQHGKSFNTLMGHIGACPGPTLILLRDASGTVMGGYGPHPWQRSGDFFGDMSSFIFLLTPSFQVFRATGYNEKFQWCGQWFSELPNGIGFGGAAAPGHFGLFLDSNMDHGHSRPVSTFANPPLTPEGQQTFSVSTIECWLLQPPEHDNAGFQPGTHGSVLDRTTDRNIMSLLGIEVHRSAGERGRES